MSMSGKHIDGAAHDAIAAERLLARELEDYEGMWVAARDHHVVASADELDALLKMIGPANDVEACFRVMTGGCAFFGSDLVDIARDSRYSSEFVGNVVRARIGSAR